MMRLRLRWSINLSVGQRLFLGLLPSLLAVVLVVVLAYYGQYARAAPEIVIVGAGALTITSAIVTAINSRYLARRITRLAGASTGSVHGTTGGRQDELDRIEHVVDDLDNALIVSRTEYREMREQAALRLQQQAGALAETIRESLVRLDDVRLPLHILLETKFGELNENQEELLGAARDAADLMDTAIRHLGTIAEADRGTLGVQLEYVQINDIVRAVLPVAQQAAARNGAQVTVSLEPALPRVRADRVRLSEALSHYLDAVVGSVSAPVPLCIRTARTPRGATIEVSPLPSHDVVLAQRLIEVQGGRIEVGSGGATISLG